MDRAEGLFVVVEKSRAKTGDCGRVPRCMSHMYLDLCIGLERYAMVVGGIEAGNSLSTDESIRSYPTLSRGVL